MSAYQPVKGIHILSLALNLPGPAELVRCQQMGATCTKLESPAGAGALTSDPMFLYSEKTYRELHEGIPVLQAHLETAAGQETLHALLAKSQVLITSFRATANKRLGLDYWDSLHPRYPHLSIVQIVVAPGARANQAGHDLTYQAQASLLTSLEIPSSLYADMSGALAASEAVLATQLARLQRQGSQFVEVALSEDAQWMGKQKKGGCWIRPQKPEARKLDTESIAVQMAELRWPLWKTISKSIFGAKSKTI